MTDPLPLSRLLDSLVISLIATLLLFTLFGTFPEQPATREIAAIDKPAPPTRAILLPVTCNATPNTCAELPGCPPGGKGAICADPQAPRVDLALSVAAPGKESGGHAPALPVMPEAKPPPETETLPNVASTQADDDKTPNRYVTPSPKGPRTIPLKTNCAPTFQARFTIRIPAWIPFGTVNRGSPESAPEKCASCTHGSGT